MTGEPVRTRSLSDELTLHTREFTFFAALRALEQINSDRPRLGEARKPADDPVRIAQLPHMYFAPAEIAGLSTTEQGKPLLEQFVFGMFGPNGALPLHLTEYAGARDRQHGDPTVKDFHNLFQHRLAALFYRAWADSDPCASRDRPRSDRFRLYIGALLGIGPDEARDRDAASDLAKLSRAGLFAPQSRPAEALEQALAEYFALPVRITPFIGEWLPIPADSTFRLGGPPEHGRLGAGATLGNATWQRQFRFEITLGPLSIGRFTDFLPGARGLEQLRAFVRLHTGDEWSWQLRLLLEPADVPAVRLGESGWLGWTTWMPGSQGSPGKRAADTIIEGARLAVA